MLCMKYSFQYLALFIQQVEDAHLGLDEVDTGLVIIEIDESPGNLFSHVFLLFQLKNMLYRKHRKRREKD